MRKPVTLASGTLSASEGERAGVKGPSVGPAKPRVRGGCLKALAAAGFAAVLLSPQALLAAESPRSVQDFDFDWKFVQEDAGGAEKPDFNDRAWRVLDIPHDWSIEGEYRESNPTGGRCGYLPSGIGWYRKAFEQPSAWKGKRVSVLFDGVYMDSTVWLNGQKLGGRPYGYISFGCDLTEGLQPGRNVLAVRVDNSKEQSSRWYHGCGIYGHVSLVATEPVHVGQWGTFVTTPTASAAQATVKVRTELANETSSEATGRLVSRVLDPDGKQVAESASEQKLAAGKTVPCEQEISVGPPKLWSPDSPSLYTLKSIVYRDGRIVDEYDTSFGIRTIRWDANTGFWLNDKQTKLKGMCEHHDGGPIGAAFPDKLLESRLLLLKDMGCNAVRTSHNPRTPSFYDLCDRLGIMVMDEIFDGWQRKASADYGARFFKEWWQCDVADWVRRDRNHPSVVIWSIGNETGKSDSHGITPLIHKLDDTRPTTGGSVFEGVDVIGLNAPGEITSNLLKIRAENPDKAIVLSEEPHTLQTRGYYRVVTWWRDKGRHREEFPPYGTQEIFSGGHPRYSSSYDNCGVRICARDCWNRTALTPWITGEFRWTGFDYLGEASFIGGKFPARIWNFGIIDLAGIPKDHYFLYQSFWSNKPMVHLLPHWTHPGLDGKVIPVVAYSNSEEVELFLNGKSLGRRKPEPQGDFVWQVPYSPGELKAVAYRQGKTVAQKTFRTAGDPGRIRLETDADNLKADRRDLATVQFSVTDDAGVMVPSADDRLDFKVIGPVRLRGYENGDPVDITPHQVSWRKVFYGLGRGFFQATDQPGDVEVAAAAVLGNRTFTTTTRVAIDAQRIALRGTLANADLVIHYTIDGREPTAAAPQYVVPFTIDRTTTVKSLVLRNGQPFLSTQAEFIRSVASAASPPMASASSQPDSRYK